MILVRSRRWHRTFVAACLPYLLLSVLVDFVHLHSLMNGTPQVAASQAAPVPGTKHSQPTSPACAVCLWMQAGMGVQPSVSSGPTAVALANALNPLDPPCPARPALLTPDLRGPPVALFS